MANCKMCIERGRPDNFGSDPRCAWPDGVNFTSENWGCATANAIRNAMRNEYAVPDSWDGVPDRLNIRREDQSFGFVYIPGHPEDFPDGDRFGEFSGGGVIVGTWYKERWQVQFLGRLDGWDASVSNDDNRRRCTPLTLQEAEGALVNLSIAMAGPKNA